MPNRAMWVSVALLAGLAACESDLLLTQSPLSPRGSDADSCVGSACTGRFVYASVGADVRLHYVDARGNDREITPGFGALFHVRWSPDGSRLVFVAGPDAYATHVYTVRPDGSALTQLSFGAGGERHPLWSPDGSHIVFNTGTSVRPALLFIMAADGSDLRELASAEFQLRADGWAPDGRVLVTRGSFTGFGLYWIDSSTGASEALPLGQSGQAGSLAPDGQTLAFEAFVNNHQTVVTLAAGAAAFTPVSVGIEASASARWAPNSKRLVFGGSQPIGTAPEGYPIFDYSVYAVNVDGTNRVDLTPRTGYDSDASYSPNGKSVIFISDRSGTNSVWVMDADGSDPRQLTNGVYATGPLWRP